MLEFPPELIPDAILNYQWAQRGTYRFISDAQLDTVTNTACVTGRFGFEIRFNGMKNSEVGKLLRFFSIKSGVGLDGGTGISSKSFNISKRHKLWKFVPALDDIIDCQLQASTLEEALWRTTSVGSLDVEVVNIAGISIQIEEVLHRPEN